MTQTVKTIKNLMAKQGVSQRNMAERIGVTEAAMCRWMQGTRNPSILYVEKMAKVLGYRLSMVITEDEPEEKEGDACGDKRRSCKSH